LQPLRCCCGVFETLLGCTRLQRFSACLKRRAHEETRWHWLSFLLPCCSRPFSRIP
jgi:hypothetical protein